MENFTFEQLPSAVTQISKQLSELKELIIKASEQPQAEPQEQFLTIQQTSDFLMLTVPTIYSKVSKGELPVMKKGKRLYFSKTDLMNYIKGGRKKTNAEIEEEAEIYLKGKKKGASNER